MLRRVAIVRSDVSKELSASFIRVIRIGELGTTLAVTSNRRTLRRNIIPENAILHSQRRENLKSYTTKYHSNFFEYLVILRYKKLVLQKDAEIFSPLYKQMTALRRHSEQIR
jgi:hypothetical protein